MCNLIAPATSSRLPSVSNAKDTSNLLALSSHRPIFIRSIRDTQFSYKSFRRNPFPRSLRGARLGCFLTALCQMIVPVSPLWAMPDAKAASPGRICHAHVEVHSSYYGHSSGEIATIVRQTLACPNITGAITSKDPKHASYLAIVTIKRSPPPQNRGQIFISLYHRGRLVGRSWKTLSPFAMGHPTMMAGDIRYAYNKAIADTPSSDQLSLDD